VFKVTKGKIRKPYFMVLYGPAGIGKSTFAAGAPNTVFIGNEEGTYNLDVTRAEKATKFKDVTDAISDLRKEKHDFKTVAIDSLGGLEPLVWDAVCAMDGSKTIEQAQGGYGKGYVMANKLWQGMINDLLALREEKGMNVIAIAHSLVKSFNDPMLPQGYDRYQLALNDKAALIWTREVDMLGFANMETYLKEGESEKKNRALSENKRILYTERRPGFEAKNRLGVPAEIPFEYSAFESAIGTVSPIIETIADIHSEIIQLTAKVKDEVTQKIVMDTVEKAKDNIQELKAIRVRLNQITKGAS
jgi:hypothetical protein